MITKNTNKVINQIKATYPGFLHYIYRKATSIKGPKAGFTNIALSINLQSAILLQTRPTLGSTE